MNWRHQYRTTMRTPRKTTTIYTKALSKLSKRGNGCGAPLTAASQRCAARCTEHDEASLASDLLSVSRFLRPENKKKGTKLRVLENSAHASTVDLPCGALERACGNAGSHKRTQRVSTWRVFQVLRYSKLTHLGSDCDCEDGISGQKQLWSLTPNETLNPCMATLDVCGRAQFPFLCAGQIILCCWSRI